MELRGYSIMRDAKADRHQTDLRLALVLAVAMLSSAVNAQAQTWSVYGGDAAGTRYSTATEITKANIAELRVAWTYHTGDAARGIPQLSLAVPSK
jgi:glucose dehydrogenase